MSELKTQQNDKDVLSYIHSMEDEERKSDCNQLLHLFEEATNEKPKMWGKDIVGYGSYHYKGKSGREGEWFPLGFSSRKQNLTIYMTAGFSTFEKELEGIGKHKLSKGCLYVKNLAALDISKLKVLAKKAFDRQIELHT